MMAMPGPVDGVDGEAPEPGLLPCGRALGARHINFPANAGRKRDTDVGPGPRLHEVMASASCVASTSAKTSKAPHAGQTWMASGTGRRLAARCAVSTVSRRGAACRLWQFGQTIDSVIGSAPSPAV